MFDDNNDIVNGIPADLETKEADKDVPIEDIKTALEDIASTVTELREASEKRLGELENGGTN